MAARWMEKGLSSGTEQEKCRKYPKISQEGKLIETSEKKEMRWDKQKTFPLLPVTLDQPLVITPSRIPHITHMADIPIRPCKGWGPRG